MNKFIKIFTVSSATLLSAVSLAQATPTHADTVDSLVSSSKGTLNIEAGSLKLESVSDIQFANTKFDPAGMTATLDAKALSGKEAKVSDATFAQAGWTISGSVSEDAPASLTINTDKALSTEAQTIFTHTADAQDINQTAAINSATMNLTANQVADATKHTTTDTAAVTVDVNWTLAQVTPAATFNN